MPRGHRRTLSDLLACGTPLMGGHTVMCDDCALSLYHPHSCRNALCPTCRNREIDLWNAKRANEVLPVTYFHLTFTVPAQLRQAIRKQPQELLNALICSVADTIQQVAFRNLHGKLGFMTALHTWGRSLVWHPHVHVLVPALVVYPDHRFRVLGSKFLLNVRALSEVFRAVFLKRARALDPGIPEIQWSKKWVVHCRPCPEGPVNVIRYLGRYAKKPPVADNQIIEFDENSISYRFKDHRTQRQRTSRVTPFEFLRRFLQHTLPKGFHRIRHYGFLAPGSRPKLRALQLKLIVGLTALSDMIAQLKEPSLQRTAMACPKCGSTKLRHVDFHSPQREQVLPRYQAVHDSS
jgi:hypothetical protein